MRLLLEHANLIVDGTRSYEDGAILIKDEYIEKVFYNANKVGESLKDVRRVSVRGLTLIPSPAQEIKDKKYILDPLNKDSIKLSEVFKNKGIKVMIGKTKALAQDCLNINYDGFYDLYNNMSGFNPKNLGLVNLAFYKRDKYVELNPKSIDVSVLKFTLDNLRKDRVILFGSVLDNIKLLRKLKYSYNDILLMTSLNSHRLYGTDKRCGTLIQGKYADIICLNEKSEVVFRMERGKLYV